MQAPFGRLSLWILIAMAVLLLAGCAPMANYGDATYRTPQRLELHQPDWLSHQDQRHRFVFLPVPTNIAMLSPVGPMESAPPQSAPVQPPPPSPVLQPGQTPLPPPQPQPRPGDRVARRGRLPARRTNAGSASTFAHHPATPHYR